MNYRFIRYHLLFLLFSIYLIGSCGIIPSSGEADSKDKTPTIAIQKLSLDQLGQLYVLTGTNELIQYQPDGTMGFRYNNNTLGTLDLIDVSNPFSILLYYPDFQTIVLLDRTLNEKTRIQLSTLGLLDIRLVALSNDNFIWLYDGVDAQLKKLDQDGNITFESDRLDLLLQQKPNPAQLLAQHNQLMLTDPVNGIFIFDQFARYETTLPVQAPVSLQMPDDHTLVYWRAGAVFAYDLRALQEQSLDLDIKCASDCRFCLGNGKVYWVETGILRQMDF